MLTILIVDSEKWLNGVAIEYQRRLQKVLVADGLGSSGDMTDSFALFFDDREESKVR